MVVVSEERPGIFVLDADGIDLGIRPQPVEVPADIDNRPQLGQHRRRLFGEGFIFGGEDDRFLREGLRELQNRVNHRVPAVELPQRGLHDFLFDILAEGHGHFLI